MRLIDYLQDKKYLILLYITTSLVTGIVIYIEESSKLGYKVLVKDSYGFYSLYISLFLFLIYMFIEFLVKRNYYNKLKKTAYAEELHWVNSIVEPINKEQQIYYDLLLKLYKDATDKIAKYNSKSIEDIEFITMWVHEIKTPIAASKLIIENNLNSPAENMLYSIEDEINKIEDFVQMALFHSKIEDFSKDYIICNVNINKLLNNCIIREYSNITNKNLKVHVNDSDINIYTDKKWLEFIIKQILDNAIKYSDLGSTIEIYMEESEKENILNIKDFGIGIKKEDLERIFDKSFTGGNGRKFYNSTGIGLYLSQKLARKLGHNITVLSEYGNGTKFSVHFPKLNDYYIVT